MQLVIIAGGKGTRLRERLGDLPKPMAEVGGRPLLEHQILLARQHGIEDVVILTGYGAGHIRSFIGDGSRWGARVRYCEEAGPLGTAGAALAALDQLAESFLVMYGDTMLNVDLERLWRAHESFGGDATLFLHPNDHPHDSDLVELDVEGRVTALHAYPHEAGRYYPNLVNAALYVLEREALRPWRDRGDFPDFGKHLFPAMLRGGCAIYGYRSPEYIKDAGTPERLDKVIADYRSGIVERGSFLTAAPAVFIDRDGTLNVERNRVKTVEDFALIEGVAEGLRRLNRSGYRTVVVTNQPVIARGECTEHCLALIHNKMETLLGEHGAYVDAIYYCPHHPDKGFPGERPELKIPCACRKPAAGLIARAQRDLHLDLRRSWLVGDSTTDIRTAANAGLLSVLVQTGHAGKDGVYPDAPDYVVPSFPLAVEFILSRT